MIRLVEQADFDAWRGLWRGYLDFYRTEVSDETTNETFDRLVNQAHGLVGLVAPGEGHGLVGLANLVFHSSTWSRRPYCYLEDLYVTPEARGQSTGRDLILAAYQEADRRGAARTYWQTQQYNGAARSLYDQLGHPSSFIVYER